MLIIEIISLNYQKTPVPKSKSGSSTRDRRNKRPPDESEMGVVPPPASKRKKIEVSN